MTKGALLKAIATEHGLKTKACSNVEQSCDRCHKRGQEIGRVHHSRSLPNQDQDQASHESMREVDVWQGDQGEGKASKDSGESLCSCCPQEADLSERTRFAL